MEGVGAGAPSRHSKYCGYITYCKEDDDAIAAVACPEQLMLRALRLDSARSGLGLPTLLLFQIVIKRFQDLNIILSSGGGAIGISSLYTGKLKLNRHFRHD